MHTCTHYANTPRRVFFRQDTLPAAGWRFFLFHAARDLAARKLMCTQTISESFSLSRAGFSVPRARHSGKRIWAPQVAKVALPPQEFNPWERGVCESREAAAASDAKFPALDHLEFRARWIFKNSDEATSFGTADLIWYLPTRKILQKIIIQLNLWFITLI